MVHYTILGYVLIIMVHYIAYYGTLLYSILWYMYGTSHQIVVHYSRLWYINIMVHHNKLWCIIAYVYIISYYDTLYHIMV